MRKTKIVCTLGPASAREDVLEDIAFTQAEGIKFWKLVETGVRPALKLPEV